MVADGMQGVYDVTDSLTEAVQSVTARRLTAHGHQHASYRSARRALFGKHAGGHVGRRLQVRAAHFGERGMWCLLSKMPL